METCRIVHRMAAITTSPAAANPLMLMDSTYVDKPSATSGQYWGVDFYLDLAQILEGLERQTVMNRIVSE